MIAKSNVTPTPNDMEFWAFIIRKANLSASTERKRIRKNPMILTPQSKIGGKLIFISFILLNDSKLKSKGQIPICEKLTHEMGMKQFRC